MNNYRDENRSMRPNHQNKRMRGRNRGSGGGGGGGGGKGPNPLTRSYESNGPEVKVRGTAQNIAEKYVQLGRDAQATGDHVAAESFFQHAEHYFRLIAAAQEQFRIANPGFRGFDQPETDGEEGEEDGSFAQGQPQPEGRAYGQSAAEGEEEPQGEFQPREQRDYQPRDNRDQRGPRPQRDNRNFQPREQREPREAAPSGDYQPREPREAAPSGDYRPREPRDQRPPRDHQPREQRDFQPRDRDQRPPRDGGRFERNGQDRRSPRNETMPIEAEQPGLPSFITAPVRNTIGSEAPIEPSVVETAVPVDPNFVEPVGVRRRGRPPKVQAPDIANGDE
jgi:hypothetical protein